nr:PREDICTED: succinate dehydrogenase [ubiquinone] cytochrome b small subunit, mitochondrial [Bemisia tabaci]
MSLSCLMRRTAINLFDNHGHSLLRATISPALANNSFLQQKNGSSLPVSKTAVTRFSTSSVRLSAHGDHSKLWTVERMVSALLLPVVPAAFIAPNFGTESMLAILMVMHTHWGIEAIVIDYVRASIFGPVIPKIGVGLVYVFSVAVLAGLLNVICNDIGIVGSLKLLWSV